MDVEVDFSKPFAESDQTAWEEEYVANIHAESWPMKSRSHSGRRLISDQEPDLDPEFADLFMETQAEEFRHYPS
jgi:hypothetical protein